jgi:hypothetical protein
MSYDKNLLEQIWKKIKSREEAELTKENILEIEQTIAMLSKFDDQPEEYENPDRIHKYLANSLSL